MLNLGRRNDLPQFAIGVFDEEKEMSEEKCLRFQAITRKVLEKSNDIVRETGRMKDAKEERGGCRFENA